MAPGLPRTRVWVYSTNNLEYELWFCLNNIKHWVSGSKKKYVLNWPTIRSVWPVPIHQGRRCWHLRTLDFNDSKGRHFHLVISFQQLQPSPIPRLYLCVPLNLDAHPNFMFDMTMCCLSHNPIGKSQNKTRECYYLMLGGGGVVICRSSNICANKW